MTASHKQLQYAVVVGRPGVPLMSRAVFIEKDEEYRLRVAECAQQDPVDKKALAIWLRILRAHRKIAEMGHVSG